MTSQRTVHDPYHESYPPENTELTYTTPPLVNATSITMQNSEHRDPVQVGKKRVSFNKKKKAVIDGEDEVTYRFLEETQKKKAVAAIYMREYCAKKVLDGKESVNQNQENRVVMKKKDKSIRLKMRTAYMREYRARKKRTNFQQTDHESYREFWPPENTELTCTTPLIVSPTSMKMQKGEHLDLGQYEKDSVDQNQENRVVIKKKDEATRRKMRTAYMREYRARKKRTNFQQTDYEAYRGSCPPENSELMCMTPLLVIPTSITMQRGEHLVLGQAGKESLNQNQENRVKIKKKDKAMRRKMKAVYMREYRAAKKRQLNAPHNDVTAKNNLQVDKKILKT